MMMLNKVRLGAVAVAATVGLGLCPTSAHAATVSNTYDPVDLTFTCNGTLLLSYQSGKMTWTQTETVNPDGSTHIVSTFVPQNLVMVNGTKTYKVNNSSAGGTLDIVISGDLVTGTYKEKWMLQGFGSWGATVDYGTNTYTESGNCTS